MNYPLIRRAAALALALVFALTLSLSLAAPAWAADTDGLNLKITSKDAGEDGKLTLRPGDTAELEAVWDDEKPQEGAKVTYSWKCDREGVTFNPNGDDNTASTTTVTVGETAEAGEATITVTWKAVAVGSETQTGTATYALTIEEEDDGGSGEISLTFLDSSTVLHDPTRWSLEVVLTGVADPDNAEIIWIVERQIDEPEVTRLPTLEGTYNEEKVSTSIENGHTITTTGRKITVVDQGAGRFVIRAQYKKGGETYTSPSKNVTVSGIVLSVDTMTILAGGSATLTVTEYGDAASLSAKVVWTSSNAAAVFVMNSGGNLTAREPGRAVITATKGKYSAECTVTVEEDTSVIADKDLKDNKFTAATSYPLTLDAVYPRLMEICRDKTAAMNNGTSAELSYITNLKVVSTDQGTLYYNYNTESDTGDGVGYNDRFRYPASGSMFDAKKLYFVPKQGFIGTAEITFNGVAESGQNFAGVIRVEVSDGLGGSGSGSYIITYRTRASEAVWFQASDFIAFCQRETGRSFDAVTFNLPKSSEGMLYYNYVAGSGNPVTSSDQFTQNGRYTVDDVCFVPNAAFVGEVVIGFRAVVSGAVIDGTVVVNVTAASTGADPSSVSIFGEQGKPVTLLSDLFNDACRATINDTLSFVLFKLPDEAKGTLYYNYRSDGTYDSRVTAATRYYYSGAPSLGGVTFVPASNATGRVAISYTGYGVRGASYSGTLYISLDEMDRSTIYYFVAKGGSVTFNAADFYNAALYQKGVSVSYVTFTDETDSFYYFNYGSLGRLYYNYRSSSNYGWVYPDSYYYYNPSSSWYQRLSLISFRAGDTVGTVTIPYTAYCGTGSNQQTFTGKVVIQVGSLTPDDINLSCYASGYVRLSSLTLSNVCGAVMNESLSYIEITGVPDAKAGHLYFNYIGFGTGTAVEQGNRFYYIGSPGISQLVFLPFARFAGKVEIPYIGYSGDGREQVSGRIVVNVVKSPDSLYFDDMSDDTNDYTWAADSVDYLYLNGTVIGVGDNCYNPSGTITRGDFALMLVRAYHLTANGSASFTDVPADSYYADAVRIAALRGIVNGYNGYFSPEDALTRQDAMLMIYNTLKAEGKTTTNGLTADLSVYYDEKLIDSYAREAMGSLVLMGVVEGDGDGYLRPQDQLNRAEAAMLLHTIMTL